MIPEDIKQIVLANKISDTLAVQRAKWIKAQNFGVIFTIELPPLNYEQAREAREDAYSAYRDDASQACSNYKLYRLQFTAIEEAEQAAWRNKSKRRGHPRPQGSQLARIRTALLIRDGEDCWLCGKHLGNDCTLEHLEPLSRGGKNDPSNYALAHEACNAALGDRPLKAKIEMRRTARKGRAA